MSFRLAFSALFAALLFSGCASKPPRPEPSLASAYVEPEPAGQPIARKTGWRDSGNTLAGRTLTVSSLADLKLGHKEVVLTFDDGPVPGKTERILDILDAYGVKATFMMVGQMADSYPAIARVVAERGHSIGSHTYRHANLQTLGFHQALNEILRGEHSITRAVQADAAFFRFPYLADTAGLRRSLAERGKVVLDVDIDSKDYFKTSPASVARRTMEALNRRGRGIILLHDIHSRTVSSLPNLLTQLKAGGYSVVTLKYKRRRIPELTVAALDQ